MFANDRLVLGEMDALFIGDVAFDPLNVRTDATPRSISPPLRAAVRTRIVPIFGMSRSIMNFSSAIILLPNFGNLLLRLVTRT
jgi:hypothetical protein